MNEYFRDINKIKTITNEQVIELAKKGDKNGLIEGNLKLVPHIAKKFKGMGVDYEDLIQEGNIGLMTAVDKFNYKRGYKFSTMASWWIFQAITRTIENNSRQVRLPSWVYKENKKINNAISELEKELEREPMSEDLASEMGINKKRLEEIIKTGQGEAYLDSPVGDTTLGNLLDAEFNIGEEFDERMLLDDLKIAIEQLDARQREIIKLFFGIDCERKTHKEIKERFGISITRVSQIKESALDKLKNNPIIKKYSTL